MTTGLPSTSIDTGSPRRLTIQSGADASQHIIVTIMKHVPFVRMEDLDPNIFSTRKYVSLSQAGVAELGASDSSFLVRVQTGNTDIVRHGLLVKCGESEIAYELLQGCTEPLLLCDQDAYDGFNGDGVDNDDPTLDSTSSISEYIALWSASEQRETPHDILREGFSMKPPPLPQNPTNLSPEKRYTLSPQKEKTPLDFLRSRYYNTLYSLSTPLSYFPKTALSRFRNMCNDDFAQMSEILSQVYLSQDQLDQRRIARFGLSTPRSEPKGNISNMSTFEARSQALFLDKHHDEVAKAESLDTLVLELKIREAQLQILLLMEILICTAANEDDFLDGISRKEKKVVLKAKKPTLIRRKRKKVIPTFLGVGVHEDPAAPGNLETINPDTHVSLSNLFTSLTALIDQIGLWDSLLERGRADKDQNTHGFLAFVVVPYFSKSLPKTVSYVIRQIKSLRPNILRTKLPKAERKISRALFSASGSEANTPIEEPDSELSQRISEWTKSLSSLESGLQSESIASHKKSKFSKTLMPSDKIPLLNRASTTIDVKRPSSITDIDDMQPAFSLKRSKSNLGSKNMKRRQVDISVVKNDSMEPETKNPNSFLFTDARKLKANSDLATNSTASVRQVEATPAKPVARPSLAHAPQVLATPSNQRTVDISRIVKETPQDRIEKKASVHDRLAQMARESSTQATAIISSPVRDLESSISTLSSRLKSVQDSSPVNAVTSSPAHVKSKPGDRISVRDSPFYNNTLMGSPPPTNAPEMALSPLAKRMRAAPTPPKLTRRKAASAAKSVKSISSIDVPDTTKTETKKSTEKETAKVTAKVTAKATTKATTKTTAKVTAKVSKVSKPKSTRIPSRARNPGRGRGAAVVQPNATQSSLETKPLEQESSDAASKAGLAGLASLSVADIFEIGSADAEFAKPAFVASQDGDKSTSAIEGKQSSINPLNRKMESSSAPRSTSFQSYEKAPESDSDSDYERLLAFTQKPVTKKYVKKRML